ncbi:hypothetical protein [Amycolatopsis sp. MEPSY49]|uniref:hypothetical protein n=1 Tax=Amycolatopsis sp. MEPSY49 TaxID=3151600 RepID=UPI003EF4A9A1
MGHKRWLAMAVAGAAVVAACGEPATENGAPPSSTASTTTGSSSAAVPTEAVVAWVDVMCAVEKLSLWNPPPPVKATGLKEADRALVVGYLTEGYAAFSQAKTSLDGLGPAPVPQGNELVTATRAAVGKMADKFGEYVQEARTYPAPDFGAPYRLAQDDVASYTAGETLAELAQQNPTVAAARKQARRC